MIRTRRNNNSRAQRVRGNRKSKNRRNVVLYRRPPAVSSRPKTTGLAASGLSTSITFTIDIHVTVSVAATGWVNISPVATGFSMSADYIFKQRPDAIQNLRRIYSEFRLDRMTLHYVPLLGNTSWGQVAIALHDDQYGYPSANMNFADVAVSPNSRLLKCTQSGGVMWVPTEASDLDFHGPTSTLATILYGASDLMVEGKFDTSSKPIIGRLLCVAHLTVRSPLHEMISQHDDLDGQEPLSIEVCTV